MAYTYLPLCWYCLHSFSVLFVFSMQFLFIWSSQMREWKIWEGEKFQNIQRMNPLPPPLSLFYINVDDSMYLLSGTTFIYLDVHYIDLIWFLSVCVRQKLIQASLSKFSRKQEMVPNGIDAVFPQKSFPSHLALNYICTWSRS